MTAVPAVDAGASARDVDAPMIPPAAPAYRRYALGMLLVIYILNFLDRQVVSILAEPIKRDLHLTDAQIGAMSGLAFALFYTFLGIAIARAAERHSRPWIIAGSMALWSGFTALCGLTTNFWQLFAARLGVGFGEAGCTPAAHSLIADDTPREKRASALAFYAMGTPLGSLIGSSMGGVVADAYGWQMAFFVAGAPGILFALIVGFTLKEPRGRLPVGAQVEKAPTATLAQTMAYLLTKPTFWLIAFAAAISAFIGYGQGPFTASFYFRNHGPEIVRLAAGFGLQSAGFVGIATGVIGGLTGAVGSLLGGRIADWAGARDVRNVMGVPALAGLVWAPTTVIALMAPSAASSLLLLAIPGILGTLWYGPIYATAQGLAPPHMRATAAAILLFIINLIGLGLGPLAVGMLSDGIAGHLLTPAGLTVEACRTSAAAACAPALAGGVKWALIASCAMVIPSCALSWLARKTIRQDLVS